MKLLKITGIICALCYCPCLVFAANNMPNVIVNQPITGSVPPGIQKTGNYPVGLANQAKVPAGWSQGNKVGWNNTSHVVCKGHHCNTIKNVHGIHNVHGVHHGMNVGHPGGPHK